MADSTHCLSDAQLDAIASSEAPQEAVEVAFAHAADCEACADLLAIVARAKFTPRDTESEHDLLADPLGPLPGQTIGRFVVQRVIGRGGMGVVVAAFDPTLDRTVAIKVLLRGLAGDTLLREARAIATVRHPNVVTVHEVDEDDGRVFLVMDHVDGPTLRAWLAERDPAWPALVRMFVGAGRGLSAAHERGLVHRDFKPENVLVDVSGSAKVIDFGLVTAWRDVPGTLELPRGVAGGTLRYMAPEAREAEEATPASDQYSFCVAMFEALLGQHPFGENEQRLERALADEARVPHHSLPSRLLRALTSGLRAEPAQRHANMTNLLDELERILRARSRNRRILGGGAVVVTAATGALWLDKVDERARCQALAEGEQFAGVWDSARKASLEAELQPQTWSRLEPRVDAYTDRWSQRRAELCRRSQTGDVAAFDQQVACLDGRRVSLEVTLDIIEAGHAPRTPLEIVNGLQPLAQCLAPGDSSAYDPPSSEVASDVDRLRQRASSAAATARSGLDGDAIAILEPLLEEARALGWTPLVIEVLSELAEAQSLSAPAQALETWRQAYTLAGDNAQTGQIGRLELAGVSHHITAGELETAGFLLSVAESRTDGRTDEIDIARSAALLHMAHGDFKAAEGDYRRILAHTETSPRYEGDLGEAYGDMGAVLVQQGLVDEGVEFMDRAVEETERAYGPKHRQVIRFRENRVMVLRMQGKADEAIAEVRALRAIAGPLEQPSLATLLAGLLREGGSPQEALPLDREVVAARLARFGERHPETFESQAAVGLDLLLADRAKESEAYLQGPAKLVRLEPPDYRSLKVLVHLGWARRETGDLEGAARVLEEALLRIDALPNPGPEAIRIGHALGDVLIDQDRFDEAIEVLEKADRRAADLVAASPGVSITVDTAFTVRFSLAQAHLAAGKTSQAIQIGEAAAALLRGRPGTDPRRQKIDRWLGDRSP